MLRGMMIRGRTMMIAVMGLGSIATATLAEPEKAASKPTEPSAVIEAELDWDDAERLPPAPHRMVLIGHGHRHVAAITKVAVSPDGRTIASAGEDLTIHLWQNADDGQGLQHQEAIMLQSSPRNLLLLSESKLIIDMPPSLDVWTRRGDRWQKTASTQLDLNRSRLLANDGTAYVVSGSQINELVIDTEITMKRQTRRGRGALGIARTDEPFDAFLVKHHDGLDVYRAADAKVVDQNNPKFERPISRLPGGEKAVLLDGGCMLLPRVTSTHGLVLQLVELTDDGSFRPVAIHRLSSQRYKETPENFLWFAHSGARWMQQRSVAVNTRINMQRPDRRSEGVTEALHWYGVHLCDRLPHGDVVDAQFPLPACSGVNVSHDRRYAILHNELGEFWVYRFEWPDTWPARVKGESPNEENAEPAEEAEEPAQD